MRETWVQSLVWEDPLKKGKATHSSILVWRIPWTLQPVGSQWVGRDWATFSSVTKHPERESGRKTATHGPFPSLMQCWKHQRGCPLAKRSSPSRPGDEAATWWRSSREIGGAEGTQNFVTFRVLFCFIFTLSRTLFTYKIRYLPYNISSFH